MHRTGRGQDLVLGRVKTSTAATAAAYREVAWGGPFPGGLARVPGSCRTTTWQTEPDDPTLCARRTGKRCCTPPARPIKGVKTCPVIGHS